MAGTAASSVKDSLVIEHKAYARVGLLGNPSDVYFGRTISFSLGNFWASVRLQPSDDLIIHPHPTHDLVQFRSLDHLVNRLQNEGYYVGVRLLMSICKVFHNYCRDNKIDLNGQNFTLTYDTNIPRQGLVSAYMPIAAVLISLEISDVIFSYAAKLGVFSHGFTLIYSSGSLCSCTRSSEDLQTGLSGSSAIVCAALSCLLDFYNVRHLIKVEVRPNLILDAEKELGIVAGLQDRGSTGVWTLARNTWTGWCMDTSLLPPLHLIYAENPSDSGKVHSTVRKRWLDGDEFIVTSMTEVAKIALEGRTALLEKDYRKFGDLMNQNFDLRRRMFGDDALGAMNIEMVEVARRVGAASKFTGSGGAVIAFCPDGPAQVKLLEEACRKAGFIVQPASVVSSFLNDVDRKTLSS